MRIRPLHLLLLAGVIFWTSGAAQFVHEMTEHVDRRGHAPLAAADSSAHQKPSPGKKSDDDDDDCPTCQLLAHMSAAVVTPAAPIILQLPANSDVPVADVRAPVHHVISSAPIRGPPVV